MTPTATPAPTAGPTISPIAEAVCRRIVVSLDHVDLPTSPVYTITWRPAGSAWWADVTITPIGRSHDHGRHHWPPSAATLPLGPVSQSCHDAVETRLSR